MILSLRKAERTERRAVRGCIAALVDDSGRSRISPYTTVIFGSAALASKQRRTKHHVPRATRTRIAWCPARTLNARCVATRHVRAQLAEQGRSFKSLHVSHQDARLVTRGRNVAAALGVWVCGSERGPRGRLPGVADASRRGPGARLHVCHCTQPRGPRQRLVGAHAASSLGHPGIALTANEQQGRARTMQPDLGLPLRTQTKQARYIHAWAISEHSL